MITSDDIRRTFEVIRPYVRRTPVIELGLADLGAKSTTRLTLKLEQLQCAGSAKIAKIRSLGANLIIGGDRYADALAAAKDWEQSSGALSVREFDQPEPGERVTVVISGANTTPGSVDQDPDELSS